MNKTQKRRLAKLSLALLEHRKNVNFDMSSFSASEDGYTDFELQDWDCGTSCCFAGYAPHVFSKNKSFQAIMKNPKAGWDNVSKWLIGDDGAVDTGSGHLWDNLFGLDWPDSPVAAVRRALFALEHPDKAKTDNWERDETPCKSFGVKKLEERLKAFA